MEDNKRYTTDQLISLAKEEKNHKRYLMCKEILFWALIFTILRLLFGNGAWLTFILFGCNWIYNEQYKNRKNLPFYGKEEIPKKEKEFMEKRFITKRYYEK
jgi:predicted membrane protein